jgi:hypothetical protein
LGLRALYSIWQSSGRAGRFYSSCLMEWLWTARHPQDVGQDGILRPIGNRPFLIVRVLLPRRSANRRVAVGWRLIKLRETFDNRGIVELELL